MTLDHSQQTCHLILIATELSYDNARQSESQSTKVFDGRLLLLEHLRPCRACLVLLCRLSLGCIASSSPPPSWPKRTAGVGELVSDTSTQTVAEIRRVDKGIWCAVSSFSGPVSLKSLLRRSRLYQHSRPTNLDRRLNCSSQRPSW
jgi:hypothetical protein